MAFVRGVSNAAAEQRNLVLSNIVFASNLAEEDDWSGTTSDGRDNGLTIFEVNLYSANTILGTYFMRLAHNSDNQVGVAYNYVGMAGGTGATLTAELRVTFTPSDAPAASAPSGGGASPNNVGQYTFPTTGYTASRWQDTGLDYPTSYSLIFMTFSNSAVSTFSLVLPKSLIDGLPNGTAGSSETFEIAYHMVTGFLTIQFTVGKSATGDILISMNVAGHAFVIDIYTL